MHFHCISCLNCWWELFLLYTLASHGWVHMTLCPGKLSTTMVNNNSRCTVLCPDGIIPVCTGGLTNKNEGGLLNQDSRGGHVPHTLLVNNWKKKKNGCFKKPCEPCQTSIDTFCLRDMCKHCIIVLLMIYVTFWNMYLYFDYWLWCMLLKGLTGSLVNVIPMPTPHW